MLGMSSAPLKRRRTSLSIPVQSAPAAAKRSTHTGSQSPRQRGHAQQIRTTRRRSGAYGARVQRMSDVIRERMPPGGMQANPARAAESGRGWGGGGCKGATSAAIRFRRPAAPLPPPVSAPSCPQCPRDRIRFRCQWSVRAAEFAAGSRIKQREQQERVACRALCVCSFAPLGHLQLPLSRRLSLSE